ncbi:hypothetical protein ERO13_D07G136700v2 [Gossypium hirsutum]|uniref:Uncharacterized protein n=4 Tax=Gossypium TaxID=3633 RepID=A0A5J5QRM2_GOSBA|nr:hypothetical protein ES319_D07G147300v1 [Gossypium barbadense]KAG4138481.1 hypothetical protein ERO13_D07G136700v2 [Gossypium hirsutum]TYG61536.1 hypothetical protein ES288_D07G156600v1 [Gossypium darwinii]TYI73748.1 hypothetical protein E1A91_D07G150900v1 [Gossypium mustelinum]
MSRPLRRISASENSSPAPMATKQRSFNDATPVWALENVGCARGTYCNVRASRAMFVGSWRRQFTSIC